MSLHIVCLPSADASLSASYGYLLPSSAAQPTKGLDTGSAPAALLPVPPRGAEVVAVVPLSALSWHSVALPGGLSATSPRLRAVLGGLLEDRLLDDEEHLHFAVSPSIASAPGGNTWVAVCDKAWLRGHLQALEAAQTAVSRIVPEFAPDAGPLELHAVADADAACWVMTGGAAGGVLRLPLSEAALLMVGGVKDQNPWTVLSEPQLAAQAEKLTQTRVTLVMPAERWASAARTPWDLAQFDLARSARSRTVKKVSSALSQMAFGSQWRPARWGLGLFLLANLVGLNVWAWQQNAQLAASRAAIQNLLTQTFPSVTVVVDAPLQMQREVDLLRQASGSVTANDLEAMLQALAAAAPASRITTLDFSAGELRVKGLAVNPQDNSGAGPNTAELLKAKGYSAQFDGDTFVVKAGDKARSQAAN